MKELMYEGFTKVGAEEWKKMVQHVRTKFEDKYLDCKKRTGMSLLSVLVALTMKQVRVNHPVVVMTVIFIAHCFILFVQWGMPTILFWIPFALLLLYHISHAHKPPYLHTHIHSFLAPARTGLAFA